jgi:hypothetical protein|tara:strand:+ start:64 stop:333 length:270 start_codon:yes stop_codon:yes gene_type:complete
MKLIISEKQFKKLILKESEPDDLVLLNSVCMYWKKLDSKTKNKFLKDKGNYTSNGYPFDPLMTCQKPLSVSWIEDRDREMLNNLLNYEA